MEADGRQQRTMRRKSSKEVLLYEREKFPQREMKKRSDVTRETHQAGIDDDDDYHSNARAFFTVRVRNQTALFILLFI